MAWFRKPKTRLQSVDRREMPGDVWDKCPSCGEILYREKLRENWNVCPECGYHLRLAAAGYVELLLDAGTPIEHDADLRSSDPLGFADLKAYSDRLAQAERKTGQGDALIAAEGELDGIPVQLAVMNFAFIGGSMGSVVGEKIARAGIRALENRTALIIVSASGGARMMEGILSLMQMAKTSSVLARMDREGLPFISVLTDPTTGGVTASYAMLGDANLAEPGALIGFAGPRVIEQTIKQELPEGFQTAEFLLEHGMLDNIVDRRQMKMQIARILAHAQGLAARVEPASGAAPGPT
ncbi:MAG TPA: acetyl-CoA carboxylase, carboxyltransferase subunit beta [Longimicrobiaceae bacterium]|nr:acetyl-CoA carboxylase, carboxyltransferase subunit beta [Longimicrobiaceae bacterium]